MKNFQNIKTFFLNYKILWKEFSLRLNMLTNERLTKELLENDLQALKNQYLVKYNEIDKKTLKKYLKECKGMPVPNKVTD